MPFASPGRAFRQFCADAEPADGVVLAYCLILACVLALCGIWAYAAAHAAVILVVLSTVRFCAAGVRGVRRFWRSWDAVVYVVVLFLMTAQLVHRVNPNDVDLLLIRWDRAMGGIALLRWTQTWSKPLLDEAAKVAWVSYYFLAFLPAVVVYLRGDLRAFREVKGVLVFAWLVSFGFYFAMPAKGPLHFKQELGLADPSGGVAVAAALKHVVAELEGGEARDTFPSGHCMIAALVMFLCLRNRLWKTSVAAVPLGLAVIASTICLRYHYVVDVVAGLALCLPVAWLGLAWCRGVADRPEHEA